MFFRKTKKVLYLRIWLTILVILTIFFGSVLIIYEEWKVDEDNLIVYAPSETKLYIHINQRSNSFDIKNQYGAVDFLLESYAPQFNKELQWFLEQGFGQVSFLLWDDGTTMQSAWLLATRNGHLNQTPFSNYKISEIGNIYLVSSSDKLSELIRQIALGQTYNLKLKFLEYNQSVRLGSYLYLNNSSQQTSKFVEKNDLANLIRLLPFGNWLLYSTNGSVVFEKMVKKSFFQLPKLSTRSSGWLEKFADNDVVFYQADAAQLWSYFYRLPVAQTFINAIDLWEAKYKGSFGNLLSEIIGPVDLVVEIDDWPANHRSIYYGHNYNWLIKIPITKIGESQLESIAGYMLGYLTPVEEEVILPDGSKAVELKVIEKNLDYQTIYIQDQEVKMIYLSVDQAYYWFNQEESIILGNNRNFIEKYITKQETKRSKECWSGANSAFLINIPSIWVSELLTSKLILANFSNKGEKYTICK